MKTYNIENKYFDYMYELVMDVRGVKSYRKLLTHLHDIEFRWFLENDTNRAEDGISLRYHFGYDYGYSNDYIKESLDIYSCSMLEMMVALAVRCEKDVMDDPDQGDRTGLWFWEMICSLGLSFMDDDNYDSDFVEDVMYEYAKKKRYLFNVDMDIENTPIWSQAMEYLNEFYNR